MSIKALLLGASAAVLLTACASTPEECDPVQDQGFFGKIGCAVTGSYEERVTTKEQHVEDLKAENARLNQLIRDVQSQDALLKGDYAQRQRELDKIRSNLYDLQASLEQKKALDSNLQNKLNAVNNQLSTIQTSPTSLSIAEKKKQIAELEATLDELSQQMINEGM